MNLEMKNTLASGAQYGSPVDRIESGLSGGRIARSWLKEFRSLPILAILLPAVLLVGCNRGPLEVQESLFCPDYSAQEDACNNLHFEDVDRSDNTIMARFSISQFASVKTWKEWNHYIYFEEPITVGFLVRWNRPASLEERSSLRDDLHCVYTISHPETEVSIRGELEGKRLESGGLWCFDYLGTLLGELQKQEGVVKRTPDPNYFPVDLKLEVESSKKHLRREVTRRILVYWR